jgi:hypothetical protein
VAAADPGLLAACPAAAYELVGSPHCVSSVPVWRLGCLQLMWALPVEAAPLLWDSSINEDTSKGGVLRDYISRACQVPLPTGLTEVGSAANGASLRTACMSLVLLWLSACLQRSPAE